MCEGWYNSVHSFFHDLGARSNELSIDRIDNNGHYSCGKCDECIKNGWKKNCRWATQREQNLNKKKINKHGYPGVKLKDGRYESYIGVGCGIHKKKKYLGSFNTAKEAGRAYFDAKATLTKK